MTNTTPPTPNERAAQRDATIAELVAALQGMLDVHAMNSEPVKDQYYEQHRKAGNAAANAARAALAKVQYIEV